MGKGSFLLLVSEGSENAVLLLGSLETAVSVLGGSVDELQSDLLGLPGAGGGEDRLADDDGSFAGSHDTTLEKQEVLVDLTVVGEATKRSNVLVDGISLSGGVVQCTSDGTSTNTVDLLVEFSSAVVAELTSAGNSPLDCSGMPSSNTTDLSQTSVSLSGHAGHTESPLHTLGSLTAGHTDGVNAV